MKIYNIKDAKRFLDRLAECKGDVELINREGRHFTLIRNEYENIKNITSTFSDGNIIEMELNFSKQDDAVSMMKYLMAM